MPRDSGPDGGHLTTERYVLIGLADHRADWMTRLSRWASEQVIPVELVRTSSAGELRALLDTGRVFSSALLDATASAVGRDLFDAVGRAGCTALVVGNRAAAPNWIELGAAAVLESDFEPGSLVRALASHGRPVPRGQAVSTSAVAADRPEQRCPTVVVTGPPGVGRSTVAMAVAAGLSREEHRRPLALADLCLEADLALLHGAAHEISGVQELVESHRLGRPSPGAVRRLLVPQARYDLLTGLRDRDDWTVLRRGSVAAGLSSLGHAYRTLVIDTDADASGEHETGSSDLEDRNALCRAALDRAHVVMVVGRATTPGLHRLLRSAARLGPAVRSDATLVPVVNQSRRSEASRRDVLAALAPLREDAGRWVSAPLMVPTHRKLDRRLDDGSPLPHAMVRQLTAVVIGHLERPPPPAGDEAAAPQIRPGELGHWTDDEEAA